MNRRTFLASTVAVGLSLITAGWWYSESDGSAAGIVAANLRKKLDYLQLDEASLLQFANEVLADETRITARRRYLTPLYVHTSLLDSVGRIDDYWTPLAERYLQGSDFFLNGMDESRVVTYLGPYDPYVRPCLNPFARLQA
ncbi:MAG: hypothetical protein HC802_00110 [Caldilineaceae bacterium]|nr:hypothetical protein [Caldilineaceae bacterium]